MDNIAEWLGSITWPLVSRVLLAMGIGTVTYQGANTALEGALNAGKTAFSALSIDVMQLLALAGFFDAMSIMSGGLVSGLAWLVLKRYTALATGTGGSS